MDIELKYIIAAIINFGILFFILKKFFFDKVNNFVENRQSEIKNSYDGIEEERQAVADEKNSVEQEMKEIKDKAIRIFEEYKMDAEKNKEKITNEAKEEAKQIMDKASTDIQLEKARANREIERNAIDLSVEICEKVLEDSLDEESQKKMIKHFISKVGTI
ncbi:F0F1 ATP synthase subunit B [Oceanirhabdus seepicola]|uniref:ATP synthase subunit b n=1 Tax=Oceanirhabdus seepicola TaxID=2828781 RepID=A0A9J6NZM9_9CLOT|nr:F0F1 ATP synthase subunit B [Oceanirhabdus seepicola]MCM1989548.1 F0F1 ATP synthase subunit B [Oceanirhabdus seepicola]